jgi:hypothetical protein
MRKCLRVFVVVEENYFGWLTLRPTQPTTERTTLRTSHHTSHPNPNTTSTFSTTVEQPNSTHKSGPNIVLSESKMKRPREPQSGGSRQNFHKYSKPMRTLPDPKAEAKSRRDEATRARSLAKLIQVHSKMARSSGESVAKPSILVDLAEEEFLVKFLNIWDEHVPGFGISKKRERNDKEMNMEWRKRLASRKMELGLVVDTLSDKTYGGNRTKSSGKKKSSLSAAKDDVPSDANRKAAKSNASAKVAAKAATSARKKEMERLRLETVARYKKLKQTRNNATVTKRR